MTGATLILALAAVVQSPGLPANLTTEQASIVYDQCLARAAQRASRTDAADGAIFGLAHADCAATRASLLAGGDGERQRIFDAIDADKRASFPELTRQVRERRRAMEERMRAASPDP